MLGHPSDRARRTRQHAPHPAVRTTWRSGLRPPGVFPTFALLAAAVAQDPRVGHPDACAVRALATATGRALVTQLHISTSRRAGERAASECEHRNVQLRRGKELSRAPCKEKRINRYRVVVTHGRAKLRSFRRLLLLALLGRRRHHARRGRRVGPRGLRRRHGRHGGAPHRLHRTQQHTTFCSAAPRRCTPEACPR